MVERKGASINELAVGTIPCFAVAALLAGLVSSSRTWGRSC